MRRDPDLYLWMKSVLLKEAQKGEFEGGTDSGGVGLPPGARVLDIAGFQGASVGRRVCQAFEGGERLWPSELLVIALIVIHLQAAVAGGFAVWMVEVLNGPSSNKLELFGQAREVATATETGIDEGE
jgi:hypothetical protein